MPGFVAFLLLVSGMGIGTLLCGLVPLSLPLSRKTMRVLEVFGAGLLVGAAVTVVIPEGASALFSQIDPMASAHPPSLLSPTVMFSSAMQPHTTSNDWAWSFISKRAAEQDHDHDHDHHDHEGEKSFTQENAESRLGSSILFGIVLMYVINEFTSPVGGGHKQEADSSRQNDSGYPSRPRPEAHRLAKSFHLKREGPRETRLPSFTIFDRSAHGIATDEEAQTGNTKEEQLKQQRQQHERNESTATAASSDVSLPDDYDDSREHPKHGADWAASSGSNRQHNATPDSSAPLLHRQESRTSFSGSRPQPRRSGSSSQPSSPTFGQALTTIVGLLIHAAADGIAMGASAGSGDQTLTMVVFIAIMVHKAPAAFGLCTMLMSQRLSRASIRKAIATFALASPLGAVLTYLGLSLFFDTGLMSGAETTIRTTGNGIDAKHIGTALAFSGGTFLFVAFHAVLELAGAEADTVPASPHAHDDGEVQILGKYLRVILLIAGACTPRFLQSLLIAFGAEGHHH